MPSTWDRIYPQAWDVADETAWATHRAASPPSFAVGEELTGVSEVVTGGEGSGDVGWRGGDAAYCGSGGGVCGGK